MKKEIRSKWCHPDDTKIVRSFAKALTADRDEEQSDTAIAIRNFSELRFKINNLVIVKNRERRPVKYKARNNPLAPRKTQRVTTKDVEKI